MLLESINLFPRHYPGIIRICGISLVVHSIAKRHIAGNEQMPTARVCVAGSLPTFPACMAFPSLVPTNN